ncbi:tubulin binding cofactor C-domain-containing protein [Boletus reticuloceps]|uniref:Tubulin binding cofactor C-domain-containing protein n=1 Tax=Boletus reticuloceps TaxID=495285 RepID=A0A8I3AF66_9AGAM|nr:tubulin binding cofactor C-domain-containing protein [Boletus reticuloceps]
MSGSEAKWTFAHKFYVNFNVTASELVSRLDALKGGGVDDVAPATMQAVTLDLSRLAKKLSDATGSLPSYDQRQCELQLKALEKSIEELRGTSTSVPRFSFKRKATKPKPSTERPSAVVPPSAKSQSTLIESAETLAVFSHRYLTILDIRSSNTSAEVSVSDLDDCIVNLLPGDEDDSEITALHVQRVSRSVILLPRISGSIILYDLSQCVIVVGCHQFRMHSSTAVDVYLESGSDPITESCSGIRFAAYPSSLVRGGTLQGSKYLTVKDFSHILPTPSPNWSLLLEEKWERSWPILALEDRALREELERMLPAHTRLENGLRT